MKLFLKLLTFLGVDKLVGKLVRSALRSILYELARRVKDEDIDTLRRSVESLIDSRLHGMPKELQLMIKEALKPALIALFEALKHTDDAALAVVKALDEG